VVRFFLLLLMAAAVAECAVTPTGRRQLILVSDTQVDQMGVTAYREMQKDVPRSRSTKVNAYVECVARAVSAEVKVGNVPSSWEVTVFDEKDVNAFALPGGKIGVYTGLLDVASNQDQLATVIGHEIAHVLARHSAERVSTAMATQTGLAAIQASGVVPSPQMMGLLGLGAQVGVELPFGRTQESEADAMGLELMARAGFDPGASVALWQRMAKAGGQKPPELLSTHPADETRIDDLRADLPAAMKLYEQARAQGKNPRCG
jgi:predicted Zn-dependent protease